VDSDAALSEAPRCFNAVDGDGESIGHPWRATVEVDEAQRRQHWMGKKSGPVVC
jgi:hypothetical protein